MTEEEKRDIVQEVLKEIRAQSQDIMSLPSSENVSEFKSLPVVATDGTLKTMNAALLKGDKGEPGTDGKDGRFRLQNHGANDMTFALTPNVMHVWGVVDSLTLTLAPNPDNRFVAEYAFQFTCPAASGTQLTLPSSVKWLGNVFAPKIGQTYQACIVNGLLLIGGTQ